MQDHSSCSKQQFTVRGMQSSESRTGATHSHSLLTVPSLSSLALLQTLPLVKASVVGPLGVYYIYCIYVENEKHSSIRFYAQGILQQLHRYNCLSMTGHKQEAKQVQIQTYPLHYSFLLRGVSDRCWECEKTVNIR